MAEPGRFSWCELVTSDPEAAKAFYGAIFGWTTQAFEGNSSYVMWAAPSGPVGGVMDLSQSPPGTTSHWTGYVYVANVDNSVARTTTLGGTVHLPGTSMGGIRFAILADPQGGVFGVYQNTTPSDPPVETKRPGLGEFSWCELMSSDPAGAFAFYTNLFGWVRTSSMDMGEMGSYDMFGLVQDANSMGGMMRSPPGMPTAWLFYANVADADIATAKVRELGGQVMHGPVDVPGGGRISMCVDPQGAAFALYAEK